jgi:hypothetical protein
MDLHQDTVDTFHTGHGSVDVTPKAVVAENMAHKAYKFMRVRAASTNDVGLYVGPYTVTVDTGFLLTAGAEVDVPVEDPSKVWVAATPSANSTQVVTVAGEAGDTFTLTYEGKTTTSIAYDAAAATVEAALEALTTIGSSNVSVAGSAGGPFTVSFIGVFAKKDVSLMTATGSDSSITVTVTKTDASAGSKYSWMSV